MDTVKGAAIAAAVASMMGAGAYASEAPLAAGGQQLLYANACKGLSVCKAGSNVQADGASTSTDVETGAYTNSNCKAKNACKGQGVTMDVVEWDLFDAMFEI